MTSRRVYQIKEPGCSNTVVESFWDALKLIAAFSTPDEYERRQWYAMSGSYAQKVRYAIESKYESLCVIERDPVSSSGRDTDLFWLDLINDFDPSYEFQRAIYLLDENPGNADSIAVNLDATIRNGIQSERENGDELALERFRKIEFLMGSETVIPNDCSATSALDRIPEIIMQRFNSHLEQLPAKTPAL